MRCIKTVRVSVFVALFLSLLYQATGAQMPPSEPAVPFDLAVNLSNTPSDLSTSNNSNTPAVASLGETVYVVWVEESSTGPAPLMTREIRFRSSADGGVTFGDPPSGKVVAIPDGSVGSLRVAAFGDNVYIVFGGPGAPGGASVTFIRSTDGGAIFESPVAIAAGGSSPDMAVDGLGNIHVVSGALSTGEIFYTHSIDGGSTFSTPMNISNTPDVGSFFPRIAAAGSQVGIVWHDTIETGDIFQPAQGEIQFVFSADSGATFSSPVNLSNSTSNSILAAIAIGNSIQVVWSEVGQVAHRSSGDGVNFTPIQILGPATGGPFPEVVFPEVAASGSIVSVAWIEDDAFGNFLGLFFRRSTEGGANFTAAQNLAAGLSGAGAEPVAIAAGSPVKVAWTHSSSGLPADNEILFRRETPTNNPPTALADGPYLGIVGVPVQMDASASSDPEGDPLTYKWNFGDRATLETTAAIIQHTYASAGSFPVTLVVNDGQVDSAPFMTTATIGYTGGGQGADVDAFLAYANPQQRSTDLPAGTTSFDVTIIYGPTIVPSTLQAFLNGAPFAGFIPAPDTSETVTIPLASGRNVLLLQVDGLLSTGRTATDRDRLTFISP